MMRRLYWLPAGALLSVHLVVALALRALTSWANAGLLAFALYLLTLVRFVSALRDRRRPRWVTRVVDEPMFWLWGAAMLALLALPLELLVAGLQALLTPRAFRPALCSAALAAYLLGLLVSAWAIWWERRHVRVRRMDIAVVDLPAELEGYRIAQLSDLHIGSFDRLERGLEWARLTNAERPDLCAVTGDLVTSGSDFHDDVASALGALSAPDGVFVTMGNHDRAENDALTRLLEQRKLVVLQNQHQVVRRGAAALTVAGLDGRYLRQTDVATTLSACAEQFPVVLLAHYPTVFRAASAAKIALMLSGHTHGGQLGIPFFADRYNLATLTRQHARGLYRDGDSVLYVHAGLGTTGPPMRLGIPPEIAIFTLRRWTSA